MVIKKIFDEISDENSTNKKMNILAKYKDVEHLKEILYLANSGRIKFYIKQIPEYVKNNIKPSIGWVDILKGLESIYKREVTGNDSKNLLKTLLESSNEQDSEIIERIISKDCKIGVGTRNINKVYTKLIEKVPYMGAKPFDINLVKKLHEDYEYVFSQIKMDGRYCNSIIRSGEVEPQSRQGEPTILTGAKFLSELEIFDDCVLNGELTIKGIPRYKSNGIITSLVDITEKTNIRSKEETNKKIKAFEVKHGNIEDILSKITYTVWDMITVDEYYDNKSTVPYHLRLERLINMLDRYNPTMVELDETVKCFTYEDSLNHFQKCLNNGEEGTVIKGCDGIWKDGKPNWCVKLKLEINIDLEIIGFNYGTGKNSNVISSLNCQTSDGLIKTSPTGIKEEMMQYITDNQESLLGTIVECKSCGLSMNSNGEYSLLHPVFKSLRKGDKNTANTLVEVKDIENMAKGLKQLNNKYDKTKNPNPKTGY